MDSKINLDSVFNSINIDIIKNGSEPSVKQSRKQFSYSMIIDKKKPGSRKSPENVDKKFKNVEQQQIINWVDDSKANACYNCETEFSFFYRKHHCRYCGKIFCHKCSSKSIVIPEQLKGNVLENSKSWNIIPSFSNAVRVCDCCYNIINDKIKINNLIEIFGLIDFTIQDYCNIGCVCKEWRTIALHYLSSFRKLQYCMPDYEFNNFEKKMLWDNRFLIQGHSLYEVALIKSIDWKHTTKQKNDEIINLIYNKQKTTSCWNTMCSRLCKPKLTEENIIYLIYSRIDNFLINKYILQELTNVNNSIIICFLPILINNIKYALDKDEPLIVKFLINRSKKSYRMANFIIWELTTQMKDPEWEKMYTNIRNLVYASLKPSVREHMKKSFQFTNRLPSVISDKCSNSSVDNIILSIKPELKCIGINYNNIIVKKSFSKPTIAELLCTKITKKSSIASSFKIMYKREDIRIDLIITNIIKLMDYILKKEERLDLFISTYNVLPIDIKKGFIEIIDDAKTLYEIQKMGFTIQNWIIENNPDTKISDLRKRFTLSCAAYCVISYLLGIGDRHLDNIMITKDGYLFHIDFSYILGRDAKFMAPEIRITPDMIDAMGGQTSKNYTLFKDICTRAFNCLRRHSNLFFILLSSLDSIKPKIQNGKYNYMYIKKQVISRFIPGENYNQAKLLFNTKVNRKRSSSYSEIIIDFCHKNVQENGFMSQVSNLSKGMIGYFWNGSGEKT